jgi:uncharacterized LabA/DUF88 family protein
VRIGVYVDGFNLYYGARGICGRGTPGWRWLDLRALATSLARSHRNWPDVQMHRVVYCTARIDAATNPSGAHDQATYLGALAAADSVDLIEYGTYVSHVRTAPLATRDEQGRPQVVTPEWPVMVQDGRGEPVPGAVFMVSSAHREEKGSDVNLATHLLLDVLGQQVDGAMVISNDSDLKLPVEQARRHVPVAIINPSRPGGRVPQAGTLVACRSCLCHGPPCPIRSGKRRATHCTRIPRCSASWRPSWPRPSRSCSTRRCG